MTSYDAVVLAGGAARRLGGIDKPALVVGGASLLETVLDAVPDAGTVVVVGPRRALPRDVRWEREDPPGGGPAAALAAGLRGVAAETVAVLAADLPLLRPAHVRLLRESVRSGNGAVLVDDEGQPQWLCGVWRTAVLRGLPMAAGGSLRRALAPLAPALVRVDDPAWFDCDTEDDIATARGMT